MLGAPGQTGPAGRTVGCPLLPFQVVLVMGEEFHFLFACGTVRVCQIDAEGFTVPVVHLEYGCNVDAVRTGITVPAVSTGNSCTVHSFAQGTLDGPCFRRGQETWTLASRRMRIPRPEKILIVGSRAGGHRGCLGWLCFRKILAGIIHKALKFCRRFSYT